MDRLRFGPRHEPDKDKPTGDTGRLRISDSLRPKPPETPAEDGGRLIIGRGLKKPETDASQEVTISPDEFGYPTFTPEKSRELISRNVSEIKRLIDLVGFNNIRKTLAGYNSDLNPSNFNSIDFPLMPRTGFKNSDILELKWDYGMRSAATSLRGTLYFENCDKIWKENGPKRFKFYLSVDSSLPKEQTDSFFNELYEECSKNKVTFQIKTESHDYDQPCIYSAQPEKLKGILVKLYKKYPKIWKKTNRNLQGELLNGVEPQHIGYVQEVFIGHSLTENSHSGRMEILAKYIAYKIEEGKVLDEELFKEAAIYAGVSPEEPYKFNPSYWKNFINKPSLEVYEFHKKIKDEMGYIYPFFINLEKFLALTPAEKFELINRTQALLKKLYDAGYKGIYVVVDLENLYETFLENYISKI